jgi:hypothetical protein
LTHRLLLTPQRNVEMNTACDICLKSFKRRDNMMRHKKTVHAEDCEPDGHDMDSSMDSEDNNDHTSDEDTEDDNDYTSDVEASDMEESTEDEIDPWDRVIEQAFDECQSQFEEKVAQLIKKKHLSEDDARTKAYVEMEPAYRKAIANIFRNRMLWFSLIRQDPLYKAVRSTVNHLRDLEDYDVDESWKYAISKRKYLFDKLLKNYTPPDVLVSVDDKDAEAEDSDGQNDK